MRTVSILNLFLTGVTLRLPFVTLNVHPNHLYDLVIFGVRAVSILNFFLTSVFLRLPLLTLKAKHSSQSSVFLCSD